MGSFNLFSKAALQNLDSENSLINALKHQNKNVRMSAA